MNELQIFNNEEFGEIRTVSIEDKAYFVGSDVAKALGYAIPHKAVQTHCKGVLKRNIPTSSGNQDVLLITEGDVYRLIMKSKLKSAEKFESWVMDEVLPSIRKTGSYGMPMTTSEQIRLLAKGNVELSTRMDGIENKVQSLEDDMPLYGCEIDEIQKHVRRKGIDVLGGKNTPAYKDSSLRGLVYADMYGQLKREYGCVSSYKSIKRKYIADVHDFIDCYDVPRVLEEQISYMNKGA